MSQVSIDTTLANTLNASTARNTTSRFSELSSEEFIRIIFTELSNQDPFEPNDSSALLDQLNSIRSIESDLALQQQLESLVFENKLAGASSMIGRFIGGLSTETTRVAGFVVSVIRQGDNVNLELDTGELIPVDNVETVIDPAILNGAAETAQQEVPATGEPEAETGDIPEGDANDSSEEGEDNG